MGHWLMAGKLNCGVGGLPGAGLGSEFSDRSDPDFVAPAFCAVADLAVELVGAFSGVVLPTGGTAAGLFSAVGFGCERSPD